MAYLSQLRGTLDSGTTVPISATPEGHIEVAVHSPTSPFGDMIVADLEPIFQTDAVYGVSSYECATTTDGVGGVATASGNMFSCTTGGTTAGYFAALQSRRRLKYRSGQGCVARFTMLFTTGIANTVQVVGVGTSETTLAFGYNGTSFGILHSISGVRCYNTLTISAGSSGSIVATVTLNGVAFTVNTTNGSTTQTAYEISKGTYTGWTAVQRGATVIFLSNASGVKNGTYSLSFASGTGAGSFPGTPTLPGVAVSDTWVPQASWNGDTCDGTGSASNPSGFLLDPTKGNVGVISIQYLGFGSIAFALETTPSGNNSVFSTVHVFKFPNTRTAPTLTQPAFPFLLSAYNSDTAASAVTCKCASFAGFNAGKRKLTGPRMTYFNNAGVTSSTTAYVPLFTVRNDIIFAGRANQCVVNLLSVSGATKGNANSVTTFFLIRNATLSTGTPAFAAFDSSSCTYWDTAATACTFSANAQVIWSTTVTQDGEFIFGFTDEVTLQPGETITLAVRSNAATSTCLGQINTREDQ